MPCRNLKASDTALKPGFKGEAAHSPISQMQRGTGVREPLSDSCIREGAGQPDTKPQVRAMQLGIGDKSTAGVHVCDAMVVADFSVRTRTLRAQTLSQRGRSRPPPPPLGCRCSVLSDTRLGSRQAAAFLLFFQYQANSETIQTHSTRVTSQLTGSSTAGSDPSPHSRPSPWPAPSASKVA